MEHIEKSLKEREREREKRACKRVLVIMHRAMSELSIEMHFNWIWTQKSATTKPIWQWEKNLFMCMHRHIVSASGNGLTQKSNI